MRRHGVNLRFRETIYVKRPFTSLSDGVWKSYVLLTTLWTFIVLLGRWHISVLFARYQFNNWTHKGGLRVSIPQCGCGTVPNCAYNSRSSKGTERTEMSFVRTNAGCVQRIYRKSRISVYQHLIWMPNISVSFLRDWLRSEVGWRYLAATWLSYHLSSWPGWENQLIQRHPGGRYRIPNYQWRRLRFYL